ncbi:MAG: serine/threonine-protein kinase [Herbaspirillum sp.]
MPISTITPLPTPPAVSPPANIVPEPTAVASADRLGRFHLLHELGRGSNGAVYLAHDPIIDRQVAIKTFNPRLTPVERKRHRQQLINEARAAGRLSHPNIVTIFEANWDNDIAYIAMEYLPGRELHKLLANSERFSASDSAQLIRRLTEAMQYAHQNGVIHRDIKPANIFVLADQQPKLVDFGIARAPNRLSNALADADQPYTLFHRNLLGTPNYMSPEQALGKQVDARTDIYSLGAVLYEMLTNRKPFASENSEQLMQKIAYQAPTSPHDLDTNIALELSDICMKALSKRPEKRYQDAQEMALALRRYLVRQKRGKGSHISAKPAADLEDADELENPRRKQLFWLGCTALVAALMIIGVGLLH